MINIDPRTKLIQVLILSTLALIYNEISILLIILFTAIIIGFINNVNFISIISRLKKLLKIIFMIALIQSLLTNMGNPLLKIGKLMVFTDYGIIKALEFILRMGIIIVSAAIITTSSSREIIQGLIQWKCPYEIAFMVSVAIRFLPIFKEEMTDMITAIQLRGIDLKKVKFDKKLQVYKYILTPITVNSVMKAKELAAAMEMRGFRAYPKRTSYMVLKMQTFDYILLGLNIGAAILFIILRGVL
ncbi:MAG TPA: energy-coupling factor transporter transmembrane component T [Sedimentibacter sp.]|jgi:energy-coupling factor transport system permease protein|nr:energy-coupling factor transporter transmembrane protein EcfT [Sedimentibacter sp.]HOK48818.1 energy-coupling factor transporter transmembrane component T [Sedimentibacter sp.]HOW23650.1 energy-coupling factor transporter transmembrane component T [Sedimentibacter sp.]HRC80691.1 energy-coupling factor transporter transmembrane component T [Sedimentibacter sp.]